MWTTIRRPQIKCVNAFVGILRSVEISCKQKTNCCKILLHLWSLVIRDDDGRSWRTLDSALSPYECSPSSLHPVHQPQLVLMHSAEPVDNTCDKRNDLAFSVPSRWRGDIHTSAYTKNVLVKVSISHNGFNDGIFGRTATRTWTRTETGQQRERRGEWEPMWRC